MTGPRTQQAPVQRPAPQAQPRGNDTGERMVRTLDEILNVQQRTLEAITEMLEANQPVLYCPPGDGCPGGIPIRMHAEKWWKNDGRDRDRLFHPLPESAWHKYHDPANPNGPFEGTTVRNHNVWRSAALRIPVTATNGDDDEGAYEPFPDPPDGYKPPPPKTLADAETGEVIDPNVPVLQTLAELEGWALATHQLARGQIIAHLGIPAQRYMKMTPQQVARAQIRIIAEMSAG